LERYTEKVPTTLATFEMLPVPAGLIEVAAGDDVPRKVKLNQFWIGKTEVTFDELDAFRLGLEFADEERNDRMSALVDAKARPSSPYHNPACGFGQQGYAALTVTHHHAQAYCKWLSEKTGRKYRLPTEAEWEYACGAGAVTEKLGEEALNAVAWWRGNSATDEFPDGKAHAVGTKRPNAWGIHDMLGNAMEWCTSADGKPVLRGGSWRDPASRVHCSARFTKIASLSVTDPADPKSIWWHRDGQQVGFRIVREE
jgi:formylglycine-generating enzyme required for sulfatase activity